MLYRSNDILSYFATAGNVGLVEVFGIATTGFLLLYFTFAIAAWAVTRRVLLPMGIGDVVERHPIRKGQIAKEIRRSLVSIAIFGGYGVLTFEAWCKGFVAINFGASWLKIGAEVAMLVIWNEVHFYTMHRSLHTPWLFRKVHRIHHESAVPTPFSTYSFHWIESMLLGSVMLLPMFIYRFSAPALLALPIISILLNTIGHSNYNLFANHPRMRSASVEHTAHHIRVNGNFGFYLPFFDRWARTALSRKPEHRTAIGHTAK
jgi:Delta7-sterol 5-desaturase